MIKTAIFLENAKFLLNLTGKQVYIGRINCRFGDFILKYEENNNLPGSSESSCTLHLRMKVIGQIHKLVPFRGDVLLIQLLHDFISLPAPK